MKKLLAVLAVSAFMVACNGGANTETTSDSTTVAPLTTDTMMTPSTDSTMMTPDSMMVDTTKH